jgi:hypothetical protein
MVKVYFETNAHANLVATFENEAIYSKVVNRLEKVAKQLGYDKVTESVEESKITINLKK